MRPGNDAHSPLRRRGGRGWALPHSGSRDALVVTPGTGAGGEQVRACARACADLAAPAADASGEGLAALEPGRCQG